MQELKEKLRQAEQNFNYADPEYVDAAIYELKAAEERFRAKVREVKFKQRVEEVKEYLRGMATLNGNIKNISEEQLEQDAKETVLGILQDEPNWLNEEW